MQKLYGPCVTFQYEKAFMFLGIVTYVGHKHCIGIINETDRKVNRLKKTMSLSVTDVKEQVQKL